MIQQDYPARLELVRVLDKGEWYNPPTQHLGKPLQDRDPITVAVLGLHFYQDFVAQAEAKFFSRPA